MDGIPEPPKQILSKAPYVFERKDSLLKTANESRDHYGVEALDIIEEIKIPPRWLEWRQTSKDAPIQYLYHFTPPGQKPSRTSAVLSFDEKVQTVEGFRTELVRDLLRQPPHVLTEKEKQIFLEWIKPPLFKGWSISRIRTRDLRNNRVVQVECRRAGLDQLAIIALRDFEATEGNNQNLIHLIAFTYRAPKGAFLREFSNVDGCLMSIKWKKDYLNLVARSSKPLEQSQPLDLNPVDIKFIKIPPNYHSTRYQYDHNTLAIWRSAFTNSLIVANIERGKSFVPALRTILQQPPHDLSLKELSSLPLTGKVITAKTISLDGKKVIELETLSSFWQHGILYFHPQSDITNQVTISIASARKPDDKVKTMSSTILQSIRFHK